jgi:hypothetical protein
VGDSIEDLEKASEEVLQYMRWNKLSPNEKKTQFLAFHRDGARDIPVGPVCVQESKSAVLLGMMINKKLDWFDHVATLEKELKQRTGAYPSMLFWACSLGSSTPKRLFMMDVFTDPTNHEKGSSREEGGIIHRLQVRQNETIRTCLRIGREEQVGSERLLKKAKIPSIVELSVRSNCPLPSRVT